jgi:hypothetical protein
MVTLSHKDLYNKFIFFFFPETNFDKDKQSVRVKYIMTGVNMLRSVITAVDI